jgi:serine/threonine protein kinase
VYKAIKFIFGDLDSNDPDRVSFAEQELKALKRIQHVRHPYLLSLDRYDIVDGRLMIVTELAEGNLWERFLACRDKGLAGIPREELLRYMTEVAEVLDLMDQTFDLQHLDIKPQNLLIIHNHIKVGDFGQVKDLEGMMADMDGSLTLEYAAPEMFEGYVSRFCDQYSLACVYQELLTGQRPFDGSTGRQLLMQHLNREPNLASSPACDRPILSRALAKAPGDRWPSVTAFVTALWEAGNASRAEEHGPLGIIPETNLDGMVSRAERILAYGPRADDYLQESADVQAAVDRDLEYAKSRVNQHDLSFGIRTNQLHLRLLATHYAGRNIAYIADAIGIVVLAVGLDQINRLINRIPYANRQNVIFTTPEVWW